MSYVGDGDRLYSPTTKVDYPAGSGADRHWTAADANAIQANFDEVAAWLVGPDPVVFLGEKEFADPVAFDDATTFASTVRIGPALSGSPGPYSASLIVNRTAVPAEGTLPIAGFMRLTIDDVDVAQNYYVTGYDEIRVTTDENGASAKDFVAREGWAFSWTTSAGNLGRLIGLRGSAAHYGTGTLEVLAGVIAGQNSKEVSAGDIGINAHLYIEPVTDGLATDGDYAIYYEKSSWDAAFVVTHAGWMGLGTLEPARLFDLSGATDNANESIGHVRNTLTTGFSGFGYFDATANVPRGRIGYRNSAAGTFPGQMAVESFDKFSIIVGSGVEALAITALGAATFSSTVDVTGATVLINANGSDSTTPHKFGFSNFSSGEAVRYELSVNDGLQHLYGGRVQLYAYHGITLNGARGTSGAIAFAAGSGASDTAVTVVGNGTSNPFDAYSAGTRRASVTSTGFDVAGTFDASGAATLSSSAHIVGAATLDATLAVTGQIVGGTATLGSGQELWIKNSRSAAGAVDAWVENTHTGGFAQIYIKNGDAAQGGLIMRGSTEVTADYPAASMLILRGGGNTAGVAIQAAVSGTPIEFWTNDAGTVAKVAAWSSTGNLVMENDFAWVGRNAGACIAFNAASSYANIISYGNVYVSIDQNNNQTAACRFIVQADDPVAGSGTEVFSVREDGLIQGIANMQLSTDGSSTTTPRAYRFSSFTTGEAVRYELGSTNDGLQTTFGGKVQLYGFLGIEIHGSRGVSGGPSFAAGSASDTALTIYSDGSSNINDWYDSSGGTLRASITAAGVLNVVGASGITIGGVVVPTISSSSVLTSKTLTTPLIAQVNDLSSTARINMTAAAETIITGRAADGSGAIGVIIRAGTSLTNATSKIASFQNTTTEKSYVDKDGTYVGSVMGPVVDTSGNARFNANTNTTSNVYTSFLTNGAGAYYHSFRVNAAKTGGYLGAWFNDSTGATLRAAIDYLGAGYFTALNTNGSITMAITGGTVDGGSAVGTSIDTNVSYSNATAKLLSIRNGGSEKTYADISGGWVLGGPNTYKNQNVTAFATGGQASGTATTAEIVFVTVCASDNDSIKLLAGVAGKKQRVVNTTAKICAVFPPSGGTIDALAANAAYSLPAGTVRDFTPSSSTQWWSK